MNQKKIEREMREFDKWAANSKVTFDFINHNLDTYWEKKDNNYSYCRKYGFDSIADLKKLLEQISMHKEIEEIQKPIYALIMKSRPAKDLIESKLNNDTEMPDYIYVMQ